MIIVVGATGFIGQAFVRHLCVRNEEHVAVSRRYLDYYDPDRLSQLILDVRADFLINAAGFAGQPNVDACEDEKHECLYANSVLPGRIGQACERSGIPWGHVSSGCIYAGTNRGRGFQETDLPNFTFRSNHCSFYSGTKALGEEVLAGNRECYVWRGRMPFNHVSHPKNLLTKLLSYERLLDVRNSLSHLDEFIMACLDCWKLRLPFGIYHVTNSGSVQTSEVAAMLQSTIAPMRTFQFFEDEDEFMRVAARAPRSSCVLDNSKAIAAGLRLTDVRDAIATSLRDWTA